MSEPTFEKEVSLEIQGLKDSIKELKNVEGKIDTMNSLLVDVKDALVSTNEKIKKQEGILDTISLSADLRKRESENSVREIKNQIREMENDMDQKSVNSVDRIIQQMQNIEKLQKEELVQIRTTFGSEITEIKTRINKLENWKFFIGPGFLILLILMLFLP